MVNFELLMGGREGGMHLPVLGSKSVHWSIDFWFAAHAWKLFFLIWLIFDLEIERRVFSNHADMNNIFLELSIFLRELSDL